jgi:hypothetical protein
MAARIQELLNDSLALDHALKESTARERQLQAQVHKVSVARCIQCGFYYQFICMLAFFLVLLVCAVPPSLLHN